MVLNNFKVIPKLSSFIFIFHLVWQIIFIKMQLCFLLEMCKCVCNKEVSVSWETGSLSQILMLPFLKVFNHTLHNMYLDHTICQSFNWIIMIIAVLGHIEISVGERVCRLKVTLECLGIASIHHM